VNTHLTVATSPWRLAFIVARVADGTELGIRLNVATATAKDALS